MHNVFVSILCSCLLPLAFISGIHAADKTPDQLVKEARDAVVSVSIHDVKKMLDTGEEVILLDVRDKEEFRKSRLPASVNISRGLLEFLVEDTIPDKSAKIVVY